VLKNSTADERICAAEFAPSFFRCELTVFLVKQVGLPGMRIELAIRLPGFICEKPGFARRGLARLHAGA
jgi:hypothetical protein